MKFNFFNILKKKRKFRVVALLTCRNESLYLARCLQHLHEQGIETCVIDNESEDDTIAIAKRFKNKGVFRIETQPFEGYFDLVAQLELKQKLAKEIDADWFIHHDTDEIREAPAEFKTLRDGIIAADRQGYNAINFDEFVFLPTSDEDNYEGTDFVDTMHYYYYFEPFPFRRVNAWKNTGNNVDIVSSGGHISKFEGRKIYPENFILRHYIMLSRKHAIWKYYTSRTFSKKEIKERGWHGKRAVFTPEKVRFPSKELLKIIKTEPVSWDRSDMWKSHDFL